MEEQSSEFATQQPHGPRSASQAALRQDDTSTTAMLLRALVDLGPRLHEALPGDDAEALYALVGDILRSCGLSAHLDLLDVDGNLRVVATSAEPEAVEFIERLAGVRFIGYTLPLIGPYAEVVAAPEAILVERVVDILEPIVPQLSDEQRNALAEGVAADRAVLAPLVVRGRVLGVLTIWGPRERLRAQDVPAVLALAAHVGIATENARLFRELERERTRWQAAVADMMELVVICDAKGHLTYFNTSAERALGPLDSSLTPEAQVAAYSVQYADGRPFSPEDLPLQVALRTGQAVGPTPLVVRAVDGALAHLVWTASPLRRSDGTIEGAVVVGHDVTRLELLERQTYSALRVVLALTELVTQAPSSADAYDLLGRVAHILHGLEAVDYAHAMAIDERTGTVAPVAIWGVDAAGEKLWREEMQGFHLRDNTGASAAVAVLREGRVLHQQFGGKRDQPLLTPRTIAALGVRAALTAPILVDGQPIGVLTLARVRPLDADRETYFASWDEELLAGAGKLVSEALERARLQNKLVAADAARLAAEEATRQRDEFLYIASHELRTPLTSIKMNLQLALRRRQPRAPRAEGGASEPATTSTDDILRRTERQVERLIRLVSDLLETSRLETGHLELRREVCDLVALVDDVVDEQRQLNSGRVLTLSALTGETPVFADVVRIQQVVTNYLTNALKYSPADQPVEVHVFARNGQAVVAVRDSGPGVPEGEQAQVWDRFYRSERVPVQSGSGIGLGLGLYLSKALIKMHGGRVGVSSARGGGSIFSLCLPLAP